MHLYSLIIIYFQRFFMSNAVTNYAHELSLHRRVWQNLVEDLQDNLSVLHVQIAGSAVKRFFKLLNESFLSLDDSACVLLNLSNYLIILALNNSSENINSIFCVIGAI